MDSCAISLQCADTSGFESLFVSARKSGGIVLLLLKYPVFFLEIQPFQPRLYDQAGDLTTLQQVLLVHHLILPFDYFSSPAIDGGEIQILGDGIIQSMIC